MRKLLFLIAVLCYSQLQLQAQGYQLTVKFRQFTSGRMFLAHYMGKGTYLADSAMIDATGTAVLKGKEPLPGGIYMVVFPGKQRYFEMLLDKNQTFTISVDTTDLVGKTVYKTSPENDLFLEYNRFLAKLQPETAAIQDLLAKRTAQDTARARPLQTALNKKIQDYRAGFINKHPESLLTSIFKAMRDPEVPPKPANEDSTFAYRYYRAHYWDDVNLNDGRLVRTPILEGKLSKYFNQVVPMQPDSVIAECDQVIAKARKDKEMFKYVLWWLTYNYETSPYMGMDAVFVHLVEKYYVPGDAYWLTNDQLNKIISRAYAIAPNLIGQQAPPLEMQDSTSKPLSLYSTKAKYTVLVFWDPTCGHCKTEVPRLDSAFKASWQKKGVVMLGIKTDGTREEWLQFIKEHHLTGWVHAWDPQSQSNYRRLYDVYSTPVVYLLDEKKKILAKRLGVEQLNGFLERLEQQDEGTAAVKK
jgi:peroxiredoxin